MGLMEGNHPLLPSPFARGLCGLAWERQIQQEATAPPDLCDHR